MMRKRFRLLGVLALVFALVLRPGMAYAWDIIPKGVLYQGVVENTNYGAVVSAYNQYDAACYVFGKDPNTISSSIKQKLSDPNYGGKFYEYAQYFFTQSGALEDVPGWVPAWIVLTGELGDLVLSDYQSVWYASTTKALHDAALVDFKHVLYGEDVEGGGGGGGSGDSQAPSGYVLWQGGSVNGYLFNIVSIDGGSLDLSVDMTNLSGYFSSGSHLCGGRVYSGTGINMIGLSVPDGVLAVQRLSDHKVFLYNTNSSSVSVSYFKTSTSYPSNGVYKPRSVDTTSSFSISAGGLFDVWNSGPRITIFCSDLGVAAPSPPSGTWPEPEPTPTPTAPEVPTPTAPVATTEPSVSGPSVVWPEITINVEPTPEGLDYTELLTAINNNLNSLRSDLNQEFDSVISSLRNIYQYLQHLDSMLERHCKHIRDSIEDNVYELELWLKSLFEWLPEQLDYDAEINFDDSELRYLLRRILNKIPGGSNTTPTTYKPNPQADEPGFFDWLLDLWHRFLIDLVSVLPDELGGLVDAFSQLTHYFPFSIPWDLFALLLLFEHEPVTPVFQIPWGYGGGDGQTQMITVDFSVWDGVMAMVRPVFLVGFCFKLALITKDLLAGFDLNKGGV